MGNLAYSWEFYPYDPGDTYLTIGVCIEDIDNFEDNDEIPVITRELERHLTSIFGESNIGMLEGRENCVLMCFPSCRMFRLMVGEVCAFLNKNEVSPLNKISRVTGFPSVTYADSMLKYLWGEEEEITLMELENELRQYGGLDEGRYEEYLNNVELPVNSEDTFNPHRHSELAPLKEWIDGLPVKGVFKDNAVEINEYLKSREAVSPVSNLRSTEDSADNFTNILNSMGI